jgi:hypothetical protein
MNGRPWTAVELECLRRWYATERSETIAQALGRNVGTVYQKAQKLGLRKDIETIAQMARERTTDPSHGSHRTRLQPGQTPWNKGQPGSTGMHANSRAYHFKPGRPVHEAHNYQPIGSLRINADGYLDRKVSDDKTLAPARRWVALHRLVWEAAHGPVPADHIVVFRPGRRTTDPDAVTLDAVELVSRAENMRRNSVHSRYPPELARVVQLRGALNRQINRKAREAQE